MEAGAILSIRVGSFRLTRVSRGSSARTAAKASAWLASILTPINSLPQGCKVLQSLGVVVLLVQPGWTIRMLCCQSKGIRHLEFLLRPRGGAMHPDASQSGKAIDESFVVLPPPAASVYKCEPGADGGGTNLPSPEGGPIDSPMQPHNSGFHSTITVLNRAFDIATTQTQVEQPLCLECMRVLSDKLDKEVEDVNRDVKAYEACLQRLEGEAKTVLSGRVSQGEIEGLIEEEERKLEAAIAETEKQCAEVTAELTDLELKSGRFKELEERYWQEFNNFQFQLISHQEERDAILAKIEVSQAHLELLKRTNVLNDAFPIWYDGDFGTINNFRLGRLPKVQVEWDEINAAWGQACLLLHTMAQYFRPKFPFGPVNVFWSTRYDKAMTLFLTCLKEFAEFANLKDKENNIPPEKCFKLPYK
ncbi:hypothetical protein DH2020_029166 [Rehmannia glutinosa]|uniref:Beclin-1-like protein n=1 Tax=Rehmannia glutinosa TaxID=99300 RepID=A0ABR0VTM1_REHGL